MKDYDDNDTLVLFPTPVNLLDLNEVWLDKYPWNNVTDEPSISRVGSISECIQMLLYMINKNVLYYSNILLCVK